MRIRNLSIGVKEITSILPDSNRSNLVTYLVQIMRVAKLHECLLYQVKSYYTY